MSFRKFFFLSIFLTSTLFANALRAQPVEDNPHQINDAAKREVIEESYERMASFPEFCHETIANFDFQRPTDECRTFISHCPEYLKEKTLAKVDEQLNICEPEFNVGDSNCHGMGLGQDFRLSDECFDGKTDYTDCTDDIDLPIIFAKERAKFKAKMRILCTPQEDAIDDPAAPQDPTEPDLPIDDPTLPDDGQVDDGQNIVGDNSDPFQDNIVADGAQGDSATGGCSLQAVGGNIGNLWILSLGFLPLVIRKRK